MPRSSLTSCSITAAPAMSPPGAADRRSGRLDAEFVAAHARDQQRAASEIHAAAGTEALLHRIGQGPAVVFVDESDQRAKRPPDRILAADSGQEFGRTVNVVDDPMGIRRQQAFAERIERELRTLRRALPGRTLAPRQHLLGGEQHAAAGAFLERVRGEFEPRDLAMGIREFDFDQPGPGLAARARA